jgi:DNA polymerase
VRKRSKCRSKLRLALTGKRHPITRYRGPAEFPEWHGFITVHPSYLLRIPGEEEKRRAFSEFVDDLRQIRELAQRYAASAA